MVYLIIKIIAKTIIIILTIILILLSNNKYEIKKPGLKTKIKRKPLG